MTSKKSRPAIAATGPGESFGDQIVLDGPVLTILRGTVFALLDANSAPVGMVEA
jgi:ABC-2 type transport system ATP-binding protein